MPPLSRNMSAEQFPAQATRSACSIGQTTAVPVVFPLETDWFSQLSKWISQATGSTRMVTGFALGETIWVLLPTK